MYRTTRRDCLRPVRNRLRSLLNSCLPRIARAFPAPSRKWSSPPDSPNVTLDARLREPSETSLYPVSLGGERESLCLHLAGDRTGASTRQQTSPSVPCSLGPPFACSCHPSVEFRRGGGCSVTTAIGSMREYEGRH
jgi:hypothetical protein